MIYPTRAFVRKYPAADTKKKPWRKEFPQTVVLLSIIGDVPSLTDEALHECRIVDMGDGTLTLIVDDSEVQECLEGTTFAMLQPNA